MSDRPRPNKGREHDPNCGVPAKGVSIEAVDVLVRRHRFAWALFALGAACRPSEARDKSATAVAVVSASSVPAWGPAPSGTVVTAADPNAPAAASAASDSQRALAASGPPSWLANEAFSREEPVDLVIEGGTVVDGTGALATAGDVVVNDGQILHVGKAGALKAKRRIDAKGLVVTPGFIDLHSHGSPTGTNRNELAMGVTTICVGQDGRSADGASLRELASRLEKKKLSVNVVPFVGHGTVRNKEGVNLSKSPTASQLEKMQKRVAKELADGAFGLTTGLEYQPGSHAPKAELIALAKEVAATDGIVMSHLRSEDDDAIDAALDELLAQGEEGGARVHVSHVKIVYGKGKERAERLLAHLDEARRRGVRVTADLYPYEASYTTIGIVFPEFAKPPHNYAQVRKRQHDELASFLRERVAKRGGPEATLFGTEPYRGKTLAEVATSSGKTAEEVLIGVGPNGASAAYFVMDPELQARLLVDPFVMVSTDGSDSSHHPRGHGSFARVLRQFVVEKPRLTLEEAVRKMSGAAAETLRLDKAKRGVLAPGYAADLLVFDPKEVRDEATYLKPHALATGMRWVFVNGVAAVAEGKLGKARGGKLLLRR